jgi:hypothetical protein
MGWKEGGVEGGGRLIERGRGREINCRLMCWGEVRWIGFLWIEPRSVITLHSHDTYARCFYDNDINSIARLSHRMLYCTFMLHPDAASSGPLLSKAYTAPSPYPHPGASLSSPCDVPCDLCPCSSSRQVPLLRRRSPCFLLLRASRHGCGRLRRRCTLCVSMLS